MNEGKNIENYLFQNSKRPMSIWGIISWIQISIYCVHPVGFFCYWTRCCMLEGRRLINKALHFKLTFLPNPNTKQKLCYVVKTKPGISILPVSIETIEQVVVYWSICRRLNLNIHTSKFSHQMLVSFSNKKHISQARRDLKYWITEYIM